VNRFRTLAIVGLLAVFAAACGSSSPSPTPEPTATPTPTDGLPSEGGFPSFSEGVVAELEALIPETIGEVAMSRSSMRGDQFLTSGTADPQTEAFLEALGVDPEDVSVALGFGFSADMAQGAAMFVFRANGASEDALLTAFKASMDADLDEPMAWTPVNLGGKDVETSGTVEEDGQVTYLYANGDTLFFVSSTDAAAAEGVIAGLP
jgi:hypothetical protein